jgi:ubiquinol-cytochrome c reductase cytochrome c1 subunit
MKKTFLLFGLLLCLSAPALASEGEGVTPQAWPHKGAFGAYDKAALQRGYQVYREVCSSCHAMKFLSYRNLQDLGYTEAQVKAIASSYTVTDGPDDNGQMFDRPARPSDRFKSPFPNDKAARAANGGALPPDLSLIVKARVGGEDYIHAILTGYDTPPADVKVNPGMNYNSAFPGRQIAMPPPLTDGRVAYGDGTPNTLEQEARDVAQFLAWASEPYADQRKQMGVKIVLFLLLFAGLMYAVKRKVWSDLH